MSCIRQRRGKHRPEQRYRGHEYTEAVFVLLIQTTSNLHTPSLPRRLNEQLMEPPMASVDASTALLTQTDRLPAMKCDTKRRIVTRTACQGADSSYTECRPPCKVRSVQAIAPSAILRPAVLTGMVLQCQQWRLGHQFVLMQC